MSDKKQIMVRLDPGDYEKLRDVAYGARVPLAVLARNWITLELERQELPDDGQGQPTAQAAQGSPPGQRSPSSKRRKKKTRR
jgi:hypothetical protein